MCGIGNVTLNGTLVGRVHAGPGARGSKPRKEGEEEEEEEEEEVEVEVEEDDDDDHESLTDVGDSAVRRIGRRYLDTDITEASYD